MNTTTCVICFGSNDTHVPGCAMGMLADVFGPKLARMIADTTCRPLRVARSVPIPLLLDDAFGPFDFKVGGEAWLDAHDIPLAYRIERVGILRAGATAEDPLEDDRFVLVSLVVGKEDQVICPVPLSVVRVCADFPTITPDRRLRVRLRYIGTEHAVSAHAFIVATVIAPP
jgi:hypothetical protein